MKDFRRNDMWRAKFADPVAIARTLLVHGRGYPFATNLSLISIPIGLLAIAIGPAISRGFSAVFDFGPWPVYVWGTVLLFGGINVAVGIGRRVPSKERAGLYVLAGAYAFYGTFVIVGLGLGGLVTGPTFLVLAGSCVQRGRMILQSAQILIALEKGREGSGD